MGTPTARNVAQIRLSRLQAVIATALAFWVALVGGTAGAQGLIDPQRNLQIEAVEVRLVNPSTKR